MTSFISKPHYNSDKYRGLYSPAVDVLVLGGGSLIALLILRIMQLNEQSIGYLAVIMLILANFVNHPHFAFSYLLFYGSWSDVKSGKMPDALARRWWLAGVAAPIILALFLIFGAVLMMLGNGIILAIILTLMGILVGWHYVKQGFGMAMMDAALKKCFWPHNTRLALLYNAYACWIASWTFGTGGFISQKLWGIAGIEMKIPGALTAVSCLCAFATTVWVALSVYRTICNWNEQALSWKEWPLPGLVAYLITLYFWIGLINIEPAFFFVIPFFHSLQYIAVIGRFKINEMGLYQKTKRNLTFFVANGCILGALGFWLLPWIFDFIRTGEMPNYNVGGGMAIGCAWMFINIHHYLIDSVLWRQGNPKVKEILFTSHESKLTGAIR